MKNTHYQTLEFLIEGIDCADCALHIEKKISQLPGVRSVKVSFISSRLQLEMEENSLAEKDLQEAVRAAGYSIRSASPVHKDYFQVEGSINTAMAEVIEKQLQRLPGIVHLKIDHQKNQLMVEHQLIPAEIIDTHKKEAIFLKLLTSQESENIYNVLRNQKMLLLTLASGFMAFAGLAVSLLPITANLPVLFFALAIVLGGFHIFFKGWKEALNLTLGMNFLMTIAVGGAVLLNQWSEAAVVIFLFSLAHLLETYSIQRARRSIASLVNLAPHSAYLKTADQIREIPVEQVAVGDIIVIKPGSRIPLDGEVTAGFSLVDQAPITGESKPVQKSAGDKVFAGSMNQEGMLEIRIDRPYQDSTLAKIIHLVEEAQSQRAAIQQFVEKFARYYTPIVVAIAIILTIIPPLLLGESFSEWFYRALVLLVISCPCALVISTPITLVSALTSAARHGVLIKGGSYLENFHKVEVLAFDKTGTLTYGEPEVRTIIPLSHLDDKEVLRIAASIETNSEHALGQAIVKYAYLQNVQIYHTDNFQAITGRGARAEIGGTTFYIGNHKLFEENGWCQDKVHEYLDRIEHQRYTAILVGNHTQLVGVIALADEVRAEAVQAIEKLRQSGIARIVMLTGDNEMTAGSISRKAGIAEFYSELLPADKVAIINSLKKKGKLVGMVGDGINDAPALATADIGISMGASGSDTAIETADIALMKDDLNKIAYLKLLSRRTVKIIQQNIFISLLLKFIFFTLAIPGLATLWMAVFADMGASLLVIFNGLRLLNLKDN